MVPKGIPVLFAAISLLATTNSVFAHDHNDHGAAYKDMDPSVTASASPTVPGMPSSTSLTSSAPVSPTYFTHSGFSGLVLAHIGLMTAAWFFVLPICKFHNPLELLHR